MNQNEGDMFLHRIRKLTEEFVGTPKKKKLKKRENFFELS